MRRPSATLAALAFALSLPAAAQQMPKLEPLPEPPPPPAGVADSAGEPQVTITQQGGNKVEEYRLNGKLYMMKVTPSTGVPYYLIDEQGNGVWSRQDGPNSALRVPMWVIHSF